MSTYGDLAQKIHQTAVDKGFWEEERNLGEMLMLSISECSEALEEHRDGKPDVYYKHTDECNNTLSPKRETFIPKCIDCTLKPEGLAIELADCMIRCLDTLQHYDQNTGNLIEVVRETSSETLPENVGDCLRMICKHLANGTNRKGEVFLIPIAEALLLCEMMLTRLSHDPKELMLIKMAYNDTRPYKHGKKY